MAKAKKQQQQGLELANGTLADPVAMRRAAEILGIDLGSGKSELADRELLGALRIEIRELLKPVAPDDQLVCQKCGERSTDATEFCPYCGDGGIDNVGPVTGIAPAGASTTAQDVEVVVTALNLELEARLTRLAELAKTFGDCNYEMGCVVKEIHDRQLFKAKGYDSFKAFAESELPFSRATAYHMIGLVEKFDRETYAKLGYKKLRLIVSVNDSEEREKIVASANRGTSAREIQRTVSATKAARSGSSPAPAKELKGSELSVASEPKPVTVLTKVDGTTRTVGFRSAKTGDAIKSAGKVVMIDADAYAEIEVGDGVFIQVALKITGKDITGLVAKYVRAEAEPAKTTA
jgi:hypothetical protein